MFDEKAKKVFADLQLPFPAVAVKFCRNKPEGFKQAEGTGPFCSFLKKAQEENQGFFIAVDNETCMGKVVLGMADLETNHGSGQVGREIGVFRTAGANARLYYEAPMLKRGVCNFVVFSPVAMCGFNPDLVICIAPADQTQLLLRATSYISGDLWESKCSFVMSCAWTYVYPYISGKVNHLFTGMHLGLMIQRSYPEGLHILCIPYQKLAEVVAALSEMDPVPPLFRRDNGNEKESAAFDQRLKKMADIHFSIKL